MERLFKLLRGKLNLEAFSFLQFSIFPAEWTCERASMAWKRSPVRSRSGPPNNPLQINRLAERRNVRLGATQSPPHPTVTPFTQNLKQQQQPPKQQTAKEAIAANVELLIEQLEAGHSEALTAYLSAMGRFRRYSFFNILEIARQRPGATHVAGMYAWNQLGRRVKKGEKGIRILAPVIGVRRKKATEAEKDIRTQNEAVLVGFRSAWVFDEEQTTGLDLPQLASTVTGDVGAYRERLMDFALQQGIEIDFKESIAPALGICYGNKIVLLPGQSPAEEFTTLVHEVSHSLLHGTARRIATTKTVRETEAEAIAFVVGKTIGLNAGRDSADYIHLYAGNAALLTESLEVIQKTSAVILAAFETPEPETNNEAEPELAQAS